MTPETCCRMIRLEMKNMTRTSALKNKKKAESKDEKRNGNKKSAKEKFFEMLELPKELVLNRPKLTIIGNCDVMIENYKGVVEYGSDLLRIKTGSGGVKISGTGLLIREITSEDIIISGAIHTLEFISAG